MSGEIQPEGLAKLALIETMKELNALVATYGRSEPGQEKDDLYREIEKIKAVLQKEKERYTDEQWGLLNDRAVFGGGYGVLAEVGMTGKYDDEFFEQGEKKETTFRGIRMRSIEQEGALLRKRWQELFPGEQYDE
ncbi:hypothetical protein HY732_02945 [Candidatus Uhrbacteria bacterium]|nr:hypothetical protein [Candidatus Uhrbacteria bacterium]